ncbi:MAG: hypothetical protein QMD36_01395 [Candidatus Aenigmarchaeota archaeon]|nr:hypothetical protein [Candidatus Aenigmarchaeota archaeon]
MKKIAAILIAIVLFSMPLKIQIKATSDQKNPSSLSTFSTIFYEDFESYSVGTIFPRGDWILYVPVGVDPENQRIVDEVSISGTKSLQLQAEEETEAVLLERTFKWSGNLIGYTICVMPTSTRDIVIGTGFWNPYVVACGRVCFWYGYICALTNQNILEHKLEWHELQEYEANKWYNVTVLMNTENFKFSVWINGILKGTDFQEEPDISQFNPIRSMLIFCGRSKKAYFDDISVFEHPPTQETKVEVEDVKYKKWNTLNVPFEDVEGAEEYVKHFKDTEPPTEADFGIIKVNIVIKNNGNYKAEGSVIARLTGDILMIAYDKNKIVPYHFDYELHFSISIEVGKTISKTLDLRVKYASLIVSTLELKDEYGNKVPLKVIIPMVSVHLSIVVKGNFDDVTHEITEDILGIGDPKDLLRRWNAELASRVKEKMIRVFLEKYYSEVLNITPDFQPITNIPTGTYTTPINILPGTTKVAVSFLIPLGITLVGLTLLPWGATTPIGATLVAAGLAMVVIDNPMPGRAKLTLETKITVTAQTLATSNMSLEIVQIVPNNVKTSSHIVNVSGKTFHVIITSNSSITDFDFRDGEIRFNTNGQSGTGFTHLTVPKSLMNNITAVYADGTLVKFILDENLTHIFVYFHYSHPGHIRVIPEFQGFLFLMLLVILAVVLTIFKRSLGKTKKSSKLSLFFFVRRKYNSVILIHEFFYYHKITQTSNG